MDFEFAPEHQQFAKEVEAFLDANDDPDVFDLTRENMAQIVDTPKRRAFMKELGHKGWLGMTWPEAYGGSDGEGIYEYLLNDPQTVRHMARSERGLWFAVYCAGMVGALPLSVLAAACRSGATVHCVAVKPQS